MNFTQAVSKVLSNYAVFSGRSGRSEYWWFALFGFLANIVAGILDKGIGVDIISVILGLGLLLPSLGVGIRRLHDVDKSGWWLLIALIPIVGWIVLIYFAVQPSQPGDNRFGPPPAIV